MSTILSNKKFDAQKAAKDLYEAMKGLGTNEKKVTEVIIGHDNAQRQKIKEAFKGLYQKDLTDELKSELSGDYRKTVMALMEPWACYMAGQFLNVLKGKKTDETKTIEILCGNTNKRIDEIRKAFSEVAGRGLRDAVATESSGELKRLLTQQVDCYRDEGTFVDSVLAQSDAQKLWEAGEKRFQGEESIFQAVLSCRSYAHLRQTFDAYAQMTGRDVEEVISMETSGPLKIGLIAAVQYIKNPVGYFAGLLNQSMKGLGTRDEDLIRLIVSRAEIDLSDIVTEYQKLFKKSLIADVKGDTRGDYQAILVGVIGSR